MISASKTTFSHYNLKILRPKVTKNVKNFRKKLFEFRPWELVEVRNTIFSAQNSFFLFSGFQSRYLEILEGP